jgi:large subunit ribosomal protein L15
MSKINTKKFRGSRTCGGGTHKNRRGAGNRGGRGKSGAGKHHAIRAIMRGYAYGKHGFKRPLKKIENISTINVGKLDELADEWLLNESIRKEENTYHIDLNELGIDKVLGAGKVTKSFSIKASSFSNIAKEKIVALGGFVIEE